jgi:2-polyprenyl-3-methyl-5-hydroxy-6-metoxy-1,4-benzoquinol methylase
MEKNEYEIMYNFENTYWWYRGLHELVEHYVRLHAKKKAASLVILDAGCGTGIMLEIAAQHGMAEGFDYSDEAMKFCRKRGLQNAYCLDLNSWWPPREKYDVIICLDVLSHESVADEERVFSNFSAALKPKGLLILNLPAFELLRRKHDKAVRTKRRYTKWSTKKIIINCGFRIEYATYRLPFLFGIILAKKTFEWVFFNKTVRSDLALLPKWVNGLLLFFNRLENSIIFSGISLPLGASLFMVCSKRS